MKRVVSPLVALFFVVSIAIGSAAGLGFFTFGYARGVSYLTNDSSACANCHVMQRHLGAWTKSSHGKFAQCNDCHAPHEWIGKYACKTRNGFFHSLAFTTGKFPQHIVMHDYNRRVVERNCRHCHAAFVHSVEFISDDDGASGQISCIRCHRTVGHDTP